MIGPVHGGAALVPDDFVYHGLRLRTVVHRDATDGNIGHVVIPPDGRVVEVRADSHNGLVRVVGCGLGPVVHSQACRDDLGVAEQEDGRHSGQTDHEPVRHEVVFVEVHDLVTDRVRIGHGPRGVRPQPDARAGVLAPAGQLASLGVEVTPRDDEELERVVLDELRIDGRQHGREVVCRDGRDDLAVDGEIGHPFFIARCLGARVVAENDGRHEPVRTVEGHLDV